MSRIKKQATIIKNKPPTIRWEPTRARASLSLIQLFRFYVFWTNKNHIIFLFALSVCGHCIYCVRTSLMYYWKTTTTKNVSKLAAACVCVCALVPSDCLSGESACEWVRRTDEPSERIGVCVHMLSACMSATNRPELLQMHPSMFQHSTHTEIFLRHLSFSIALHWKQRKIDFKNFGQHTPNRKQHLRAFIEHTNKIWKKVVLASAKKKNK